MLRVQAWAQTDVGKQRKHNEDNYILEKEIGLYGVADGMGGHAAGEVASEMALASLKKSIEQKVDELRLLIQKNPEKNRKKVVKMVSEAVQQSARTVYDYSQEKATSRGMGTTLSAMVILGNKGIVAHVGDSRVYLFRDDNIMQLTEDHSLVNEQLRLGLITPEEADRSPYKNVITRAVGASEVVEPDIMVVDLKKDDTFLICSDGLHGYINEQEFETLMREEGLDELTQKLTDTANDRGGKDNITTVLVQVQDGVDEGPVFEVQEDTTGDVSPKANDPCRRTEISLRMDILQTIPLFEHMSYEELVKIMGVTFLKSYNKGETIYKEETKGDLLYIVLEGELTSSRDGEKVGVFKEGEHFGELAVIEKLPRCLTVVCDTDHTSLLTIQRKKLLALLRDHQGIAVKLLWGLMKGIAPRLRNTTTRMAELLKQSS